MKLLIVGCGYVGGELVRWLRTQANRDDHSLFILTRSEQRAKELRQFGIQPLVGHWLIPESLPPIPEITRILVSIPQRADGTEPRRSNGERLHAEGLSNIYSWLSRNNVPVEATRLIYLSTTGVFGEVDKGQLVNESTTISPCRIGPKIAAAAETWITQNQLSWPATVLRLAGIYGPGRVPLINALRDGQSLAVPKHGLLNLIHVADVARAIAWLLDAENPAPLYLLSDGHPVLRERFYGYLAEACGMPKPEFVEPGPTDSRTRRATDKCVDSSLFWKDSGLKPIYPDYQAGLQSVL